MLMFVSVGVMAQEPYKVFCELLLQLISDKKQAFGLVHLISIWLTITEKQLNLILWWMP